MKKLITLILLSFGLLHCSAQPKLAGKTYVAEVGASCKDGVGMFYTYRVLAFRKKSVKIKVPSTIGKYSSNRDALRNISNSGLFMFNYYYRF